MEPHQTLFIHVTLLPYLKSAQEMKTKPTQHSVKELQGPGHPAGHAGVPRGRAIPADMRKKLALFCNVPVKYIIQNLDAPSLYQVPLMLEREDFAGKVLEALGLYRRERISRIGKNWSAASATRKKP